MPKLKVRRRAFALTTAMAVALVPLATTTASAAPPETIDLLRAYSIIPPGQDALTHSKDQLAMYAALADDDDLTEEELGDLFHPFQFGPGDVIEREYQPPGRTDVTIYRDDFGIPHIYGDTDVGAAYALGYVAAEDRMWHMDILRHAAKGQLSEILGPNLNDFDKTNRRDGYSRGELGKIVAKLADRWGQEGAQLSDLLDAYSNGVNARIEQIRSAAVLTPLEYLVQGVTLEDWDPLDTAALAIFQLRSFGGESGEELERAADLKQVQSRLGKEMGKEVFEDLLFLNDPNAYPSIPESEGTFPSADHGAPVDPRSIAIPDNVTKLAGRLAAARRLPAAVELAAPSSNFLAVAPEKSATGNSLEWGGPQVGYSVPQFFIEIDVHSPSFDFRGPALPGASLFVPLGRGPDFAWSLTTGASNVIDTRVERLCAKKGKKLTKRSKYYSYKGKCRAMTSRKEVIRTKTDNGMTEQTLKVFRTVHGPVVARSTVKGKPVAVTQQRAYWKRELDFIITAQRLASNTMDSIEEFDDALSIAPLSFNTVYADSTDIGYWHVGRYPNRAEGASTLLPVWGDKKWDWDGFMPWEDNPKMINPEQGWVANWNNKPSAGWDGSEHATWGPTQRVRLLSEKMAALFTDGGKAELSDVVDVVREAATQDGNAVLLSGRVLPLVEPGDAAGTAVKEALEAWIGDGAHRRDRDRDEVQDFPTAVAAWDTLVEQLFEYLFVDELGGATYGFRIADDAAHSNGSSYFFDSTNYMWNALGNEGFLDVDYCDNVDTDFTESCAAQVQSAFDAAVAELVADQGSDPASWTWPADYIEFSEVGAQTAEPIPWQNRGTYNHAVEVLSGR
jgi:acyl-homoserine lactone acylase PvdQ